MAIGREKLNLSASIVFDAGVVSGVQKLARKNFKVKETATDTQVYTTCLAISELSEYDPLRIEVTEKNLLANN